MRCSSRCGLGYACPSRSFCSCSPCRPFNGRPERESSLPAHHSGYRSLRDRLGSGLAGFLIFPANFANYSVIYGILGATFALLLYFYISAAVLLLGAEVNVTIRHCTSEGKIQKEERRNDHKTPDAKNGNRKDV